MAHVRLSRELIDDMFETKGARACFALAGLVVVEVAFAAPCALANRVTAFQSRASWHLHDLQGSIPGE
jgi:hypothetical protein